jgi:hypothetical protein
MTGEGAGGPEEDDTKVGQRWLGREARFCGGSGQGGRRTEKKNQDDSGVRVHYW